MTARFGEKLRLLRQQREISQTDLAQRLGLSSHAVLSNLEAGRRQPSLDVVLMIVDLLGTTSDYLLRDLLPVHPPILSTIVVDSPLPLDQRQFSERLRELRQAQGLTQAALAQCLGLTTNAHISYMEAGRKEPSLDLIVKIADFFGVSCDYLLLDDPSRPTTQALYAPE